MTWVVVALSARWILGFDWPIAILLGSMLTVTGPTVFGPLLRHIRPTGRTGPVARWEGIVIDPVGAILAVLVQPSRSAADRSVTFTTGRSDWHIVVGAVGGWAAAQLSLSLSKDIPDQLKVLPLLMIVAAVSLELPAARSRPADGHGDGHHPANRRDIDVRHILEFKENLTVLLIFEPRSSCWRLELDPPRLEHSVARSCIRCRRHPAGLTAAVVFGFNAEHGSAFRRSYSPAWLAPERYRCARSRFRFAIRLGEHGDGIVPGNVSGHRRNRRCLRTDSLPAGFKAWPDIGQSAGSSHRQRPSRCAIDRGCPQECRIPGRSGRRQSRACSDREPRRAQRHLRQRAVRARNRKHGPRRYGVLPGADAKL